MTKLIFFNPGLLFVMLFPFHAFTKEIRHISSGNSRHVYAVTSSPDIRYTWKVKGASLISGQNTASIIVKGSKPPEEVTVWETPVFKNNVLRPEDFGAKGNDLNDDTRQVQDALDELKKRGGGTLQFESGKKYIIKSITVYEGIALMGKNSILIRPDNMPNWTRMISSDGNATYAEDSKPILISGLILDGNAGRQGAFRKYEMQQSHLMFFAAGIKNFRSAKTGKVKVFVENCQLRNGVADGISQYVNSDLTVRNCTAQNLFRGGYVCTGGNSVACIKKFVTKATDILTGIDIEVDGAGYNENYKTNIWIDSSTIHDGDFEVSVKPGSRIVVSNTRILNPPITLELSESTFLFHNSELCFSANNKVDGTNYILFPTSLYFVNCRMVLKFEERTCITSCLFIRNNSGNIKNQDLNLHIEGCHFSVQDKPADKKCYGLAFFRDGFTENHLNIYNADNTFSKDFEFGYAYGFLNKDGYCRSSFQQYSISKSGKSIESYQDFYPIFGKIIH